MISLHFTNPVTNVLPNGSQPGQTFDILTLEDEDFDNESGFKVAKTSKLSISYDI